MGSHLYSQEIKPLHSGGNTGNGANNVEQNADAHADQRADAGSLGGIGLGVLPGQEQDQTNQGNAEAQKAPAEAAVIYGGGGVVLRNAAAGADYRVVIDLSSTIFTKASSKF